MKCNSVLTSQVTLPGSKAISSRGTAAIVGAAHKQAGLRSSIFSHSSRGGGAMAGQAFKKFLPLFDRVLVERVAAETMTKGGIMLPEKSQGKVLQATVVAVGPGSRVKDGDVQPVNVKVGETVLLPEYGGTKVVLDDKDYYLFRDGDILGKYTE
ncbi:10 kDa heat shock protein, mitochondrial isoform X1 [Narcine bancroftii]|uniref:10 kDa heat shock protein, mitochondrial isoform X1 n=2 Tax=Narcine bancroftii TaxID=1343680 RepID=UPI00383166A7